MLLVAFAERKLLECFMKKNCRKQIKKELKVEEVIKRKDDQLYVGWKGYDNSFNSWIDTRTCINESIFSRTIIFRKKSEN